MGFCLVFWCWWFWFASSINAQCFLSFHDDLGTPPTTSDPLACSKVLRLPRNLRRCAAGARRCQTTPDDARAHIRPLGKQQSAAPAPVPADARRRQTTPGRTSEPLASSKVLRLPAPVPTPDDARACIRPLASSKRRTQHANASGSALL